MNFMDLINLAIFKKPGNQYGLNSTRLQILYYIIVRAIAKWLRH